jgi:hypothetical protein
MMTEAILFTRCLGLNDNSRQATAISNPSPKSENPGATEVIDCLNVTTTEDGAIESVPGLATVLTHSAPVTALSAGKRFLLQDAGSTHEWDGSTTTERFPGKTGAMVHTPIDCRVGLFKSLNASPTMTAASVGTNPNPEISRRFAAMPAYSRAFVHHAKLYAINAADPRFLQYSEDYHYDLWNLGDGFIGHQAAQVDGGSIPGCLLVMSATGVTAYVGSGPADFVRRHYPCQPLTGTLYSGFIAPKVGYGHVFLCTDGVYLINAEGTLTVLTGDKLRHVGGLNASYAGATVADEKYLALGNSVAVELNFRTQVALKRTAPGTALATWNGTTYFAVGSLLRQESGATLLPSSVTFPRSNLGAAGRKGLIDLYFTGRIDGECTITATGEENAWTLTVPALGSVYNRRLKTPKAFLGNHISLKIETASGAFRLESLRALLNTSQRSR